MSLLRTYIRRLAAPDVVFYALPWLMVLLVAGTVAQRDMGLYAAQATFFSSWIFWFGPLPLPGGYATIGLMGAALAAKFVIASPWRREHAGIIIAHLGALVLLLGGLLTAATAREGYVLIPEGGTAQAVADYHQKHLVFTDADGDVLADIPHTRLRPGDIIEAGPLRAEVVAYVHNGVPEARTETMRDGLPFVGPAAQVTMRPVPVDTNEEAKHSAVTVAVRGSGSVQGGAQDGIYMMTDIMPHQPVIGDIEMRFGRVETPLPFAMTLDDVKRELYPGTEMARGYESHLQVHDGETIWPAVIRMNEPLRYKGYTFYQSNYIRREDGTEITVLSAVWNMGRLFPYIASAIITAGLLWHLIISMRRRKGKTA